MIKSYQSKSNVGILLGLVLSIGPQVYIATSDLKSMPPGQAATMVLAALAVRLIGTGLFIWGCCMYAKAKGRSAGWGAFGLLSIIGLIVLVCLKDYAKDGIVAQQRGFDVMMPPPQYPGAYPQQQYPPQYPPPTPRP